MDKKYKTFKNRCLTTMILEIEITECEKSFREIMKIISALEQKELSDNNLKIKDIYFK